MHLSSCEHPIKVFNRYTNQIEVVPCGECNTCKSKYSFNWINRLEAERMISQYTLFFTLTYEEKYLPCLDISWSENAFLPDLLVHKKRDFTELRHNRNNKNLSDEYNDFKISVIDTDISEQHTQNIMRLHANTIPYLSVYDLQNFVKRLRAKVYRKVYRTTSGLKDEETIRYFIAGEYGPTSLRPHYHGLFFFDNPEFAEIIPDVLSEVWSFGSVRYDFVASSASSYVAKYVNCSSHLPRIYRNSALRPFCISSRRCPIGLRSVTDSTVKEVLLDSSPYVPFTDSSSNEVSYVPLWRTLEDRLFPKLPRNCALSDELRYRLFAEFTTCPLASFQEFCESVSESIIKSCVYHHATILQNYLDKIVPFWTLYRNDYAALLNLFLYDNSIKRVYYCARRVAILCYRYSLRLYDYVSLYNQYWTNKSLVKLKDFYSFQQDYALSNDCRLLLNMYPLYFDYLRTSTKYNTIDYQRLQTFGFTFSQIKEISNYDKKQKSHFFRSIHSSRTMDYIEMVSLSRKMYNDTLKTKKKNEYLQKHPELKNLY